MLEKRTAMILVDQQVKKLTLEEILFSSGRLAASAGMKLPVKVQHFKNTLQDETMKEQKLTNLRYQTQAADLASVRRLSGLKKRSLS